LGFCPALWRGPASYSRSAAGEIDIARGAFFTRPPPVQIDQQGEQSSAGHHDFHEKVRPAPAEGTPQYFHTDHDDFHTQFPFRMPERRAFAAWSIREAGNRQSMR
jgi:hypothetical protein